MDIQTILTKLQEYQNDSYNHRGELSELIVVIEKELSLLRTDYSSIEKTDSYDVNKRLDEIADLERAKAQALYLLNESRPYNKGICFSNIRFLMRKNNVKLGEIERTSGLRVGYMSRLEKEGNTTEPSVAFLVTAAKMLHVTVDELLFVKFEDSTEEMEYLSIFFKSLYEDTKHGRMHWTKEWDGIFSNVHPFDGGIVHPLVDYDPIHLDSDGTPLFRRFVSDYYPEKDVSVIGEVYYGVIPDTNSRVFILPCRIEDTENEKKAISHWEVYLVDNDNNVNAVYDSIRGSEFVTHIIDKLYDAAGEDTRQIHIDADAKAIIDNYLSLRKL